MIKWRKRLEFVSHEFDLNMKRFRVHMSSSPILVVVVVITRWHLLGALTAHRVCADDALELYTQLLHPPRTVPGYVRLPR